MTVLDTDYITGDPDPAAALNATNTQVNTNTSALATLTSGKEPADADLTAIAALTPSNDDILQRKAGAWTNRTLTQLKADLGLTAEDLQDLIGAMVSSNSESGITVTYDDATGKLDFSVSGGVTDLEGLTDVDLTTPADDDVLQQKAGVFVNRTLAQLKTDLGLTTEDLQDIVGAMVSGNTETNITVTYDDTNGKLNFAVTAAGGGPISNYSGDGSDGAVTLNGSTTYNGFSSLSSNVYTLTRDVYATTLVIDSGVTLKTANFVVHAKTSVTNNGTISANGNDGANAGGAGGGNAGGAVSAGTLTATLAGGAGPVATGVNGSGGASSTIAGLVGGNGGAGAYAGGTGGTCTAPTAVNSGWRILASLAIGYIFKTTVVALTPGGGGGGGGGDGTNKGGGGGSSAGLLIINTPTLVNNGTISANGGNGGVQTTAGVNCGAGGGGAGGAVILNTGSAVTGSGSITANAGTGGASNGTGGAGTNGAAGVVLQNVWV